MLEAKSWAQKDVSFHRCSIVFLSSSCPLSVSHSIPSLLLILCFLHPERPCSEEGWILGWRRDPSS